MVSAVFHSPLEAVADERAAARAPAAAKPAAAAATPMPEVSVKTPRVPFDFRGLALKVLPPIFGIALLIGVWALLTIKSSSFPTPLQTFDAAAKLFADPFYSKGPNDQGIGWNILFSLQRVAVGFGKIGRAHV